MIMPTVAWISSWMKFLDPYKSDLIKAMFIDEQIIRFIPEAE